MPLTPYNTGECLYIVVLNVVLNVYTLAISFFYFTKYTKTIKIC